MAAGLPQIPPGAMPPGAPPAGGPPSPGPSPISAMAGARPSPPGAGGMGDRMLQFLAGIGFKDFVKSMKTLRGGDEKGKGNPSQAGGLLQKLQASRALPQSAVTPGGAPGTPPMLQGGQPPGFLAMLAQLAAATQGKGGQ